MRLPISETGHPFSGTKVLKDLRPQNTAAEQNAQQLVWYVTLFAVNTNRADPSSIELTLSTPDGDVTLLTASVAAFTGVAADVVTVIERYPMRGPVALTVDAGADAMCFGYLELGAEESALLPDVFNLGGVPTTPFALASGTLNAASGLTLLHLFNETEVEEFSAVLEVASAEDLELRFYEIDGVTFESFTVSGLVQALKVFDRIPMLSGSVQAQATGTDLSAVYGTIVRR